ncbi:hypothetical protein PLICRDRAFT_75740, partial [Plicaturopsis crispa FD-325 SS-3]
DEPPDGGYGWVCVASVFSINAHTWGVNSSYGVFLAHYLSTNAFPGSTSLDFAFIGGLSISQALLISPLAVLVTRHFGTRATLFLGVIFETLSLIGASFATQIWQLFLSQGICFGWGMGFLFVGSVGIPSQWFSRRRSLANGICSAGSGAGGLTYSLATNAMIQSVGLPWAFRILALVSFGANFIGALLVRDRNKKIGSRPKMFDHTLLQHKQFLLLLGWAVFSVLGQVILLFSLPDYARSIGLTAKQGSVVGALLNLGQATGRPLVGLFSDKLGRINMAGCFTFFCGFCCFVIWIFAKSYGVLIFFAIIVGMTCGTVWSAISPVSAEVVGLKDSPTALSIALVILAIPSTFSEPIALELRSTTGDKYLHCQIFTGSMYIAAALCLWFLRDWKIEELRREAAGVEKSE